MQIKTNRTMEYSRLKYFLNGYRILGLCIPSLVDFYGFQILWKACLIAEFIETAIP